MRVLHIDHVQLAMPPDGEPRAVAFYEGVLGISHVPKPAHMAVRGGCMLVEFMQPDDAVGD